MGDLVNLLFTDNQDAGHYCGIICFVLASTADISVALLLRSRVRLLPNR